MLDIIRKVGSPQKLIDLINKVDNLDDVALLINKLNVDQVVAIANNLGTKSIKSIPSYQSNFETFYKVLGMPTWEFDVHHRIPQKADPNNLGIYTLEEVFHIDNLFAVDPKVHAEITAAWQKFWKDNADRIPSQTEVAEFAAKIDKQFGQNFWPPIEIQDIIIKLLGK